jgi:hypothetical protein
MKGLTTCLNVFNIQALSKLCPHGFGPDYCTRVMCEDGRNLANCHFVQEWIMLRNQEVVFRLFWQKVVKTECVIGEETKQ